MTTHPYPNREHQKADETARRRAMAELDAIMAVAHDLRRKVWDGITTDRRVDADDAQVIQGHMAKLPGLLAELGTLYDIREWHAADQAEKEASHD